MSASHLYLLCASVSFIWAIVVMDYHFKRGSSASMLYPVVGLAPLWITFIAFAWFS